MTDTDFTARHGPWALVAGASMGIGAALSHEAASRGLNLYAVGGLPDRHEAFLDACSADGVRRLEQQGVRFAA